MSRAMDLAGAYAERLGVETSDNVSDELVGLFEHLSQYVLCDGAPQRGKSGAQPMSAEAATAYGELWVLTAFLADARAVLTGSEATR